MSINTPITRGQIYTCISTKAVGFYYGDRAEVIDANPWFDSIEVRRSACLSIMTLPLSTFENCFAMLSADNKGLYSLDEQLSKSSGPQCECGSEKTYGKNTPGYTHSHWCPIYRNDK